MRAFIQPYGSWIMAHPPVIPKLYYGAISIEQRALEIARRVCGIEAYLAYLSEHISQLEDELRDYARELIEQFSIEIMAAIDELGSDLTDEMEELRDWVYAQTLSMEQWDVTRGLATDSPDAMRRLFFDVTTDGTTVDALAASTEYTTVDELAQSGWNCRALAVIGAAVLRNYDESQWHVS